MSNERLNKLYKLREVVLPDVVARYCNIETPRKNKYGAQLIFEPNGNTHKAIMRAAQAAFLIKFPKADWKDRASDGYLMPVRLGDSDYRKQGARNKSPQLKGKAFINCNSKDPVIACDKAGRAFTGPYQRKYFYDGACVTVRLQFYGYEPSKSDDDGAANPGITCCLTHIMPGSETFEPFPSAIVDREASDVFKEYIDADSLGDDEDLGFGDFDEPSTESNDNFDFDEPSNSRGNNTPTNDGFDDDIPF